MRFGSLAFPTCMLLAFAPAALAQSRPDPADNSLRTGNAAFGDWRADAPLVRRKITVDDLPKPFATRSANNFPRIVARLGASPRVPPGFQAELFASDLKDPRALVVAPNGDLFAAESEPGRIRVLRASESQAKPRENRIFASGLNSPFGMAFYPPGPDPQWIYIANTGSVVRYPYRTGDLTARGTPEVIVPRLAEIGRAHV